MKSGTNLRDQLVKSFMGVGAMYLLGIPVALLCAIILARALGPEAYGQYAFVMALLTLIGLPVAAGLPQLLTREVASCAHAGEWSLYRGVVRAAHLWVILVSLLVLVLYAMAGPVAGWLPAEGKWALLGIAILLVPFQGLNAVRNGTIKGLGFPALAEMPTQIIQPLSLLTAFGTLAVIGVLTAQHALWAQVFVGALTFVIASILFIRIRPQAARACQPTYQTSNWLFALLPFTLIGLLGTFSAQIGVVMLGLLGTDEGVAALQVADRGAQLVALSLTLVNMVISPHIVKTYRENNTHRLQKLSRQSARGAFLFALPIGLVLIVFGKPIIKVAFGADYAEIAYLPMLILVCGQLFNVAMGPVGLLLSMSGHEKMTLVGYVAALMATAISAYFLIPLFQQAGAAMAVTIGILVVNGLAGYSVMQHLKIRPGLF